MSLTIALQGSPVFLTQLASASVRALILSGAAGLALAAFRVKSTPTKLFAWTAVLYGALALPLLGWILPPLSVSMPAVFPTETTEPATNNFSAVHPAPVTNYSVRAVRRPSSANSTSPHHSPMPAAFVDTSRVSYRWTAIATVAYLTITLFFLTRFAVAFIFTRRLLRASQGIQDPRLIRHLAARTRRCNLSAIPHAAESECISIPVTIGVRQSTILLPADWHEWGDAELDAVLAHEVSHVARRDPLTQRLALLHRAIFWFSPLAWWLNGHLARLAEQASDEAALSCGADRTHYARTLLGFFEALHSAPGRVWWQGVSMAKAGQAEQRLKRILAWKGAVPMNLKRPVAVLILAVAIPLIYVAAAVRTANASQQAPSQPPARVTTPPAPHDGPAQAGPAIVPVAPMLAPSTAAPVAGIVANGARLYAPPAAARAPYALLAPALPAGPGRLLQRRHSSLIDFADEERFVIVTGEADSYTMSGSSEYYRHALKLKKQISGDFIWFERDEKSYIIRDAATVARAKKLWAPQEELGKKQEELGKQQEALGHQQEALDAKMEQVRISVPDVSAELDRLKAKLQKLGSSATIDQIADLQSEIGDLQNKIGDVQSQAGDQQSKVGEEMSALGEKQEKLGEQEEKLGEQQEEAAQQASRQMKELLDEAISKGTAQPEAQTGGASL